MNDVCSLHRSVVTTIRVELARRNLRDADLARMCGWRAPYLSRRMSGAVPFNTDEIDKVASVLCIPVVSLTNPVVN